MNIVYLSPHFPPNYKAFCIQLKALGATVLGIGDTPRDHLDGDLQAALTDYYRVDDLHRYDQLQQACQYFIDRYGPIDRLDSHSEYWLETEANLRSDFQIPGIQRDTIAEMKRKSLMKARFLEAGVEVIAGKVCQNQAEAQAFADSIGFPLVVKPDIGVGAASTYKLESQAELDAFFESHPHHGDFIFEEFIDGDLYSFDGLADKEGNLCFVTAHRFSQGIMTIVHENLDIFYYSLREIPADLDAAGRRVLKAFNLKERFFHFEFFRRHRDQALVALEVNMRPPGGPTTDIFNYANDFDIYREWGNVLLHNQFKAKAERPYHVIYIGRKHHIPYVHSHQEILDRYADQICTHHAVPNAYSPALGNYGYILRSPDIADMQEAARYALLQEAP